MEMEVIKMFAGMFVRGVMGGAVIIFIISFIVAEVEYRQMQELRSRSK